MTTITTESAVEEIQKEKQLSVESDDPQERKLARRLRIQRRLEAAQRQAAIEDGSYVEPEPEKPLIDETIETSEDTLWQLYLEGKEMVTNVILASEAKEMGRRELEAEEKNTRLEKLREDSELALEKLSEISAQWEIVMEQTGPLELHQSLKDQKAKCLELIEQKNNLIKGFNLELKIADEKYMKDRKAMYDDLSLLTKRIDEQILLMKRAYRIEAEKIEDSVDKTREQLIEKHMKTWQSLYNLREKNETVNMNRKFKMVKNFQEELHQLHIDHEEKYRETKIQLENDIQAVEQELEKIKAVCLLNSEKLDYNYQILKKREEENVYIKNHQKRRLNKLQDMVTILKKKIDDKRTSVDEEFKKLSKDVERYYANVLDMERKAEHFSKINDEKFQNVWAMKEEEAKDLVDKILAADIIIHEQILGLEWVPPAEQIMDKFELTSYKTAMAIVNQIRPRASSNLLKDELRCAKIKDLSEMDPSPEAIHGHRRLLRHILALIADQSGFLIEEKLDELLRPYSMDEKTFVQLDNVFVAIGINTEKDIDIMRRTFLPYAICLICERKSSGLELEIRTDNLSKKPNSRQHSILHIRELEEKVSKLRIQAKINPDEYEVDYGKKFSKGSDLSQKVKEKRGHRRVTQISPYERSRSHDRTYSRENTSSSSQKFNPYYLYSRDHSQRRESRSHGRKSSSHPRSSSKSSKNNSKSSGRGNRDSKFSRRNSLSERRDNKRDKKNGKSNSRSSSEQKASSELEHEVDTTCDITHPLIIEKHYVLRALRDFVSTFHSNRCKALTGISAKLESKRFTLSRLLSQEDVESFWYKFLDQLPVKLEKIWKGVYVSLNRYLEILQERHKLNEKAQALKRQNLELKNLLAYYRIEKKKEFMLPVIPSVPHEMLDLSEIEQITAKLTV